MSQLEQKFLDEFATLEAFCVDEEVPMKDRVVSLKKMKQMLVNNKDESNSNDFESRYDFAFDCVYQPKF